MKTKPIPEGYHTITPYMAVKNARGLIDFLKKAFDATVEVHALPDGTIYNAQAKIGDSMVLIGEVTNDYKDSDLMPVMLYLYVEDADEWYRKAIAAGAESIREPSDQWYGDRVAAVRDLVNNQWWFATHKEDMSTETMTERALRRKQQ